MEERKQLSVSEKNGILNELTKRGIHQDVVDLVKADLDFGLSQEQTQKYLSKKMDIRQMKVYSQCLRKGYPEEVLAVIVRDSLNGYQMQIALEFYQKGVPLETISQVTDSNSQAVHMQQALQSIWDEMQNVQESVKEEPGYAKQLIEEIKSVVSKIEIQDKRYDALNEKMKIFESTKMDEEVRQGLLNSLDEKDQMLSDQQDQINLANATIARLRNEIETLREEKRKMDMQIKNLEDAAKEHGVAGSNIPENTEKEEASKAKSETVSQHKPIPDQVQQIPYIYGLPAYYVPIQDASGNIVQRMEVEKNTKKTNGAFSYVSKLIFKKKSRQDIVKLVASGELNPAQLEQIRNAIEKGLSEAQLLELIHSKVSAEQMQGVIEIAVSINSFAE